MFVHRKVDVCHKSREWDLIAVFQLADTGFKLGNTLGFGGLVFAGREAVKACFKPLGGVRNEHREEERGEDKGDIKGGVESVVYYACVFQLKCDCGDPKIGNRENIKRATFNPFATKKDERNR